MFVIKNTCLTKSKIKLSNISYKITSNDMLVKSEIYGEYLSKIPFLRKVEVKMWLKMC